MSNFKLKKEMKIEKNYGVAKLGFATLLFTLFANLYSFAQDAPQKVDVDINAGGDNIWYGQPWVWAVGVAIFVVVLVVITRSNNNRTAA
jgi:hypothetical protein